MRSSRCALLSVGDLGDIGTAVAEGIAAATGGVQVLGADREWDLRGYDLAIAFGPMQPLRPLIARLAVMKNVPPVVVWFTEQVPHPQFPTLATRIAARARYSAECANGLFPAGRAGRFRALGEMMALQQLGVLRLICAFTETNAGFLRRLGLPAARVPMGFHPLFGENLGLARDVDVVFLGSTRDKRRRKFVGGLEEKLVSRGISVVVRDGSAARPAIFGQERTNLLNRAKVMLNLMRQPWDDPVFRILLAAPNGAMVLSEEVSEGSMGPFRSGEHFAVAAPQALPDAIEFYVNREAERTQIARSAYEFVTTKLTMTKMTAELLRISGFCDGQS